MDLNLIPFGLIESNDELVDVAVVKRGKQCGCICPSCRTPLVARYGETNVWHFAHAFKNVYEKTKNECVYSFYLSVMLMARQLVGSKITLTLPSYQSCVQEHVTELSFFSFQEDFTVTQEKDITIEKIQVETNFSGVPVDIIGGIHGFEFVIYFTHPKRAVPTELTNPINLKCGIISIALDSLPELFLEARRNKTKYKDVLIDLLSSKESKTWVYHPNFKKAEAVALQDLEQKIKQEKKNSDERIRIAKENQLKLELELEMKSKINKNFFTPNSKGIFVEEERIINNIWALLKNEWVNYNLLALKVIDSYLYYDDDRIISTSPPY
jgi:hypothetical protein